MKKITKSIIFFSVLTFIILPQHAHAYLDPNTGSYLLQIAAAVIFGGLFLLKSGWGEVKRFVLTTLLRKETSKSEKQSTDKSK